MYVRDKRIVDKSQNSIGVIKLRAVNKNMYSKQISLIEVQSTIYLNQNSELVMYNLRNYIKL